jgi:hypothetical protein
VRIAVCSLFYQYTSFAIPPRISGARNDTRGNSRFYAIFKGAKDRGASYVSCVAVREHHSYERLVEECSGAGDELPVVDGFIRHDIVSARSGPFFSIYQKNLFIIRQVTPLESTSACKNNAAEADKIDLYHYFPSDNPYSTLHKH